MIFNFPMIVHNEDGYWGEFPDVDGCNAQGDTLEELLEDAKKSLELHLFCLIKDGVTINKASYPKDIEVDDNSFVTIISANVDLNKDDKSVKKTLTIPSWLNKKALENGLNFSQTLQEALVEKLVM